MSKLAILGGTKTIEEKGPHLVWPRITKPVEEAVVRQLHTTVSIYDRSGVFQEFEDVFANYHGRRYALLSNSGTTMFMICSKEAPGSAFGERLMK